MIFQISDQFRCVCLKFKSPVMSCWWSVWKVLLQTDGIVIDTVTALPGMLDGPLKRLTSPNKNHPKLHNFKDDFGH